MAQGRQTAGELVGRARELAELEHAVGQVAGGARWTVELVGEPGIGKSRLLLELCRRAEQHRFLVLEGRAAEFERDIPFGVIVDALNDYVGSLEPSVLRSLDGDTLHELASIFPSLTAQTDAPADSRTAANRYRVHYAIRALLERLARDQPVLMALDDLHWADDASFEVIAHLLRRFNGPMLMGLAFRQIPARLVAPAEANARAGVSTRIAPAPLSADEGAALLGVRVPASTRDRLYLESGGNPFYLEQLARADPANRLPVSRVTDLGGEEWAPPPALASAIAEELNRFTEEQQRLLGAAAVAGESFDPSLVSAIAEIGERDVLAVLDELLGAELVRATALPRNFRFRHPILRRVVYDRIPAGTRIVAHARAAAALADAGARETELAHHLALSAGPGDEWAIDHLVRAGRAAAARAPLTAGRWLLAASRLIPPARKERRARLLAEAGASLTSGGAYDEALAALEEALELASEDALELRAELVARRAEARRRGGRPFDSRAQLETMVRALERGPVHVDASLELVMDRYWHGDLAHAGRLAMGVREQLAGPASDALPACLAASIGSIVATYEQRSEDALALLLEAESLFAGLSDERFAERIYLAHYMSEAALRRERAQEALAHVRRGFEVARLTGQDATSRSWIGIEVEALLLQGQAGEAARTAAQAIDRAALEADDWRMIWLLAADSLAALWAGEIERAATSAGEMLGRAERSHPDTIMPALARVQLAGALLASGDPDGAGSELSAITEDGPHWVLGLNCALGWDTLVRAHLARGDLPGARGALARAENHIAAASLPRQTAVLACARGELELACGEADKAAEHCADALLILEEAASPLLTGRCRRLLGTALLALGERERAIDELAASERALSAGGAVREADLAARELRRLGHRVPRPGRAVTPTGLPRLSAREHEVAAEVAAGKTNREVAATLFLSEKTIESHLARIYGKLDVHSRAALAAAVARSEQAAGPDRLIPRG